jgi:hypothetical protein
VLDDEKMEQQIADDQVKDVTFTMIANQDSIQIAYSCLVEGYCS